MMLASRILTRVSPSSALRAVSAASPSLVAVAPRASFSRARAELDKEEGNDKAEQANTEKHQAEDNEPQRRHGKRQQGCGSGQFGPFGGTGGWVGRTPLSDIENFFSAFEHNLPRSMRQMLGNDFFDSLDKQWGSRSSPAVAARPKTDIIETDSEFLYQVELAGFSKGDVKLEIKDEKLRLSGERKQTTTYEEGMYKRIERSSGSFVREFPLPQNVDASKISASFENGLLEVKIPKASTSAPQVIDIQ